jgi:putative beta-barrel porin BBP2
MRRRVLIGAACVAATVVAAIGQFNTYQAEKPPAVDESKPATVTTPTSDAEANEAAELLAPQAPGESPRTEARETMQPQIVAPAEEALVVEEEVLPPEPTRKLWRIIPLFSAGVLYDDNIFLTNTNRDADVIWTISFGLAFELGDFRGGSENYVKAQWVGMPTFYTNNPNENSFNQAASLLAQYRWTKLVGQFQSNFRIAREGNREVHTITTTQTFSNILRFQYDYSGKTSFDLQFSQGYSESSNPSGGTSAMPTPEAGKTTDNQYETKAGMNYQMFPKTNIGLEVVGGITDQSSTPLQYYQQGRLRVSYVSTGKLTFKLSAGVEAREFEGSNSFQATPVFSLGCDYRPFDGTTLSVVGYRNVFPATSITGQNITATGFEIAAQQRFLQKFIAGISLGYENDVYSATGEAATTDSDRVDDYVYVRPRLSYSFVRWVSVNLFYEYRRTDSSQATSSFSDNRIGMDVATQF